MDSVSVTEVSVSDLDHQAFGQFRPVTAEQVQLIHFEHDWPEDKDEKPGHPPAPSTSSQQPVYRNPKSCCAACLACVALIALCFLVVVAVLYLIK